MGCTGDRVWASSPQGWAFRDDVHWLYLTNLNAFDIEVSDEHGLLAPARATYYPSHIHYEGVDRKEMTASASFTYRAGQGRESVDRAVRAPQAMDLLVEREAVGLVRRRVRDAPNADRASMSISSTMPLPAVAVLPIRSRSNTSTGRFHSWNPVKLIKAFPERPKAGENRVRFEPVQSTRFRLVLQNAGGGFYTGIYGLKPINETQNDASPPSSPLAIHRRQVHHGRRSAGLRHPGAQPDRPGADDLRRADHPAGGDLRVRVGRQRLGVRVPQGRRGLGS